MKNAFKKAKKAVSKAGQHIRWSSSESGSGSASRHAASERMSISTEEPKEFQTSSTHRLILILESQLVPRSQDEAKALRSLNQKTYALTKCFDEDLLIDTGMREFNEVFQAIGWSDFAEILEGGIILLTKEFLMTLRTDTQRDEDVRCLYAMWKKIKFAPTLSMVRHWQGLAQSGHIISIMSFVTRIANGLGMLANATVSFIPNDPTRVVKESHFIHAHFLRKDTNGKYIMIFRGSDFELPLPAPQYKLYSVRTLTMQLESKPEPGRNSISRVMTRAQRRRAEEQIRKANEDAQQPGAAPAWAHPNTLAWEANSQGSWHSSWNAIVPSANPTPSYHSGGPSHSARYTGGELDGNFTALFEALDLQEHRTLGMMDILADIQQQQGVDHNLIWRRER
ncbi:hypothetical protein U9M48_042801, partial [Paspalum notatum var. saurae]